MNTTLLVCAGLGTTGTSAVDVELGKLGLKTAKWTHVTEQPAGLHVPSNIMKPLMSGMYKAGMFDSVDAVLDSPAIDFLPWILQNYKTKIILTERDSKKWASRRARMHPCAAPPFRTWFLPFKVSPCRPSSTFLLEHTYIAWTAYVVSLSERNNIPLLRLNLFTDDAWKEAIRDFVAK